MQGKVQTQVMVETVKRLNHPKQGWRKFAEEVAKTAKPKRTMPDNSKNLKPGRIHLVWKAPRCTAISKATGVRCKQVCVRGAQRCYRHGGALEVPNHPHNHARLADGTLQGKIDNQEARRAFFKYDRATRETVNNAITATTQTGTYWTIRASGAAALQINDNGKSFRRWQQELKRIQQTNNDKKPHKNNSVERFNSQKK